MIKEYKANDDLMIRAVAMNAIALAVAHDCEIALIYRQRTIKVCKDYTINKVVSTWNKIKDNPSA
jgi:hypothetical protein